MRRCSHMIPVKSANGFLSLEEVQAVLAVKKLLNAR